MSSFPPNFLRALRHVLDIEGGFSDHPDDSGGATRFGITEAVARRHGWDGKMNQLPEEFAQIIYFRDYWQAHALDEVAMIASPGIATQLFDMAVNVGAYRAILFLQRALNAFNLRGQHYSDLSEDGVIGPNTLGALTSLTKRRQKDGILVLQRALASQLGSFYLDLATRRQKDESFVYGWFLRRVTIPS